MTLIEIRLKYDFGRYVCEDDFRAIFELSPSGFRNWQERDGRVNLVTLPGLSGRFIDMDDFTPPNREKYKSKVVKLEIVEKGQSKTVYRIHDRLKSLQSQGAPAWGVYKV